MNRRPPYWMLAIILLFLLPVFSFPVLLGNVAEGYEAAKTFVWIYPFYMLLSAWLAYSAYTTRPYVSWILLILMAMSTMAVWLLVMSGHGL